MLRESLPVSLALLGTLPLAACTPGGAGSCDPHVTREGVSGRALPGPARFSASASLSAPSGQGNQG